MGTQGITARHVGVVVACCLQCCIPVAMIISTPGIFYPVIADDLGVQTAQVSAWMSVAMLSSAVFSPIVGNLLERVHLKTLRVTGVLVAAVAMVAFSQATAPWMLWVAAAGVGYALVLLTALGPATLINRWFRHRVGALMGLYAAFTAIGGVVFLLLGQAVIDAQGWRAAYLAFAGITLVVGFPGELLLTRERPQDCGLLPYGAPLDVPTAAAELELQKTERREPEHQGPEGAGLAKGAGGEAARQPAAFRGADDAAGLNAIARANRLMRTAPFWLLVACGFLMNLVCQVNGYFPKYVLWLDGRVAVGMAAPAFAAGAVLASVCQAGSAVGKIGLGLFSDFSVRNASIALAACGAVGVVCVWMAAATPLLVVGGFAFGFFIAGVLVLMPMLCRAIFGSGEVYPVLYSRVAMAPTFGGAVGNIVWPHLADNLGGFDAVFGISLVMVAIVLACALAALRRPVEV